jgi:hypothetical protein
MFRSVFKKLSLRNWFGEILIAIERGWSNSAFHVFNCFVASKMTQLLIGTMSAISSASGMNSEGGICPNSS